jgi:hypothetical protein
MDFALCKVARTLALVITPLPTQHPASPYELGTLEGSLGAAGCLRVSFLALACVCCSTHRLELFRLPLQPPSRLDRFVRCNVWSTLWRGTSDLVVGHW